MKNNLIQLIIAKIEAKDEVPVDKSSPFQSEYLFQVETGTSRLKVFWIPRKELRSYKLDLTFP